MAARVQHTLHGVNARVRTSTPKRPLQWRIDCPAPGFGDPVSPHIDHLAAGSHRLGGDCCPPDAQKLCHRLRRNLVGDQCRLGDATWSGVCKKLKDAPPVVVQRDRAQLPLRVIFLLFTTWPFDRRWHLDARAAITVGDPYRQRHLVAGYSAALRRLRSQTGTIHVGILRSCFEEPNSWGYP